MAATVEYLRKSRFFGDKRLLNQIFSYKNTDLSVLPTTSYVLRFSKAGLRWKVIGK